MKCYTRLVSLLLAISLLAGLAACSDGADKTPSTSDNAVTDTESSSGLSDDFVVDTSAEDICLATLGVPGTSTLFTVNGEPVTANSYLYWLLYCIDYMETYMSYYGLAFDMRSDATLATYAKLDALSAAMQYSLIESKAKGLGYTLTEDQVNELETYLALSAEYMGGEEAFRDELRKAGFGYDAFYAVNAASYYYTQLQTGLFSEPPTDEEMDAYIEENDILYAKHILLMTVDSSYAALDEETIAQKRATAEGILAQLQNSSDLETDFDALMFEYSEDPGLTSYPDGYTFTAGEMVTEFEEATRALEYGQISGIVESSSTGYHIILRLDPDTETARAEYQTSRMNDQIELWSNEADILTTEEYDALDIALFYEKYTAYQAAFDAEAQVSTAPDTTASAEG